MSNVSGGSWIAAFPTALIARKTETCSYCTTSFCFSSSERFL